MTFVLYIYISSYVCIYVKVHLFFEFNISTDFFSRLTALISVPSVFQVPETTTSILRHDQGLETPTTIIVI